MVVNSLMDITPISEEHFKLQWNDIKISGDTTFSEKGVRDCHYRRGKEGDLAMANIDHKYLHQ